MSEQSSGVQLVKVLLDTELFQGLDYTQISSILESCVHRDVEPGEVLCEPRTIDDKLVVLLKGKLSLESAEGKKFAEMTPVRILGEMGVFTGQMRSSRVIVQDPSTILELEASKLQELVDEDPQMENHLLVKLITVLYGRVYDTNEEMQDLQNQADRLRARLAEIAPDDPLLSELYQEDSSG